MKRTLLASAFAGALLLGACTATQVSDAQVVVNDAEAVLATGLIPAPASSIASEVLSGLQVLINVDSSAIASGSSAEGVAFADLTAAVKQVQANSAASSKVYSDAGLALTAIDVISSNASASAQSQLEADVGTLLLDYLAANAPVSATPGAAPSQVQTLISDARAHLAKLQG